VSTPALAQEVFSEEKHVFLLRREACFDGEGGSITVQTAVGTEKDKTALLLGCRRWDSNPHEVALTGFFESDKDCAMVRDAAL
jgi:hypothetical protein